MRSLCRRLALVYAGWPEWIQIGLAAIAIGGGTWLVLVGVLVGF